MFSNALTKDVLCANGHTSNKIGSSIPEFLISANAPLILEAYLLSRIFLSSKLIVFSIPIHHALVIADATANSEDSLGGGGASAIVIKLV